MRRRLFLFVLVFLLLVTGCTSSKEESKARKKVTIKEYCSDKKNLKNEDVCKPYRKRIQTKKYKRKISEYCIDRPHYDAQVACEVEREQRKYALPYNDKFPLRAPTPTPDPNKKKVGVWKSSTAKFTWYYMKGGVKDYKLFNSAAALISILEPCSKGGCRPVSGKRTAREYKSTLKRLLGYSDFQNRAPKKLVKMVKKHADYDVTQVPLKIEVHKKFMNSILEMRIVAEPWLLELGFFKE